MQTHRLPCQLPGDDRLLTSVTLAFHCLPDVGLDERAAAARTAGFGRIGLSARRLRPRLTAGGGVAVLLERLRDHGITVGEVEVLRPLSAQPDPDEELLFETAACAGGVPVTAIAGEPGSLGSPAEAAARFAAACDRAADRGLSLALEFLPWTAVPDLAAAARIVAAADRRNGGLCLDVWHLYRSGDTPVAVDPYWELISVLQLSDGPLRAEVPDLLADCLANRRPLGAGAFDLVGLLSAARRQRPEVRLSLEVISRPLRELPTATAAAAVSAGLGPVLERAGWPTFC